MIRYVDHGDIRDDPSDVLVVAVCTVPGVMGAGQARAFAERWPQLVSRHRRLVQDRFVTVDAGGAMTWFDDGSRELGLLGIWMFPTKDDWRRRSQLPWIEAGLDVLVANVTGAGINPRHPDLSRPIRSVALPALGCGLGGLAWEEVRPLLEHALRRAPAVDWAVYLPGAERNPR